MNKTLVASMEAIDFQRDSIYIKEMAMQLDHCLKDPSKDTFNKAAAALSKIAMMRTGIKFNFHFSKQGGPNAFVFVPQATSANPMTSDRVIQQLRRLNGVASEKEVFKGEVNLKTGKVSGIYSEIPIDIFCATEFFTTHEMIRGGLRAEHIAAVLLHEQGHAFTYLRYLGKMVIGNVVVSEIIKKQQEGEDPRIVQEVVALAEKKTGYRLRELGEINNSTNPLIIQQIVMKSVVSDIRSELGTRFYDRRAFEFSSDQFVARHGGAHLIVQALDIMYRLYPTYIVEYRGKLSNIFASLVSYGRVIVSGIVLAGASSVWAGPVAAVAMVAAFFTIVFELMSGSDDGVYDPIPKRFEAMRRELIASSKDQNLTIQQRTDIVEQLQAIDEVLDRMTDKYFFGPAVIGNYLAGIFNGRPGEQKFQRQLENLVNNQLFELSNKLQTKTV